jgi:hypothetical protein
MPLLSIEDLVTPMTRAQVENLLLDIGTTLGLQTRAWQPLGMARTIIATVAQKIADLTLITTEIAKGGFLDLASPAWQRLVAFYVYNVQYIAAAPATGTETVTNSTGSNITFALGALHVANAITGKTYTNQAGFTVNASSSLDFAISSDEVGTASNAAPGQITVMVTPLPGVTVTNAAAVLGTDDEAPSALSARCKAKLAALSPNGPKDAYNFVAKSAPTSAPITRTNVVLDVTTGVVTVYVATADGPPTGGDVAIVDAQIQALAVPVAVTATTVGATAHAVAFTLRVWLKGSTLTNTQAAGVISDAIATYMSTVPIGGTVLPGTTQGYVFLDAIVAAAFAALPGVVVNAVIDSPLADVAIAANEVPTLSVATVTVFQ